VIWRSRRAADPIWDGVYERFADLPASDAHASSAWLDAVTREVGLAREGDVGEDFVLEHEALLLVLRGMSGEVRVLDFGGGVGQSYAWVKRVEPGIPIRWRVVELPEVVARGRELFAGDDGIEFSTTAEQPADIVFVKSALQYVDDWSGTMAGLFALGARYVILEKFSGVASRTYATAQVNLGDPIPYWFISFDELFRIADRSGYRRILWRRLPRLYDQSGFPAELRMSQASTIVFAKV